jgi:hypothetical protein
MTGELPTRRHPVGKSHDQRNCANWPAERPKKHFRKTERKRCSFCNWPAIRGLGRVPISTSRLARRKSRRLQKAPQASFCQMKKLANKKKPRCYAGLEVLRGIGGLVPRLWEPCYAGCTAPTPKPMSKEYRLFMTDSIPLSRGVGSASLATSDLSSITCPFRPCLPGACRHRGHALRPSELRRS